jgi:hypothetical protein
MKIKVVLLAALASMLACAHAAVLTVDSAGQLTGASGVDVNGTLYDVMFMDGTCIDNFNGCDSLSDFTFDQTGAGIAAQALLDQVFLDVASGDFDSVPTLTNGCTFVGLSCNTLIPFELTTLIGGISGLTAVAVINASGISGDSIGLSSADITAALARQATYAIFSLSDVSEVPLPAAFPLFLAGIAGLSAMRRRKKVLSANSEKVTAS